MPEASRRDTPKEGLSTTKKAIFSGIVLVFFVVAAESLLRLWVYYVREDFERYDASTQTWILLPGTHRALGEPVVINSDGFAGAELQEEGDDLWRIAAVGDSNTFGGGSLNHSYPAAFQRILNERARPGQRYEVVNAGIQGLDSLHALRRLRAKVLPLGPDVVTIYIGWNDLMKFDPLGDGGIPAISRISRFVDGLWLVKGMRKLMFLWIRPHTNPPAVGPGSRSGRYADFVPHSYIENVEQMIAEIRAIGAQSMIFTLPTVVREDFTVEDVRDARVFFPYYPSAYSVGDLLDLVAAYNRAIRMIAAKNDVPVVDLAGAFETRPDYRSLFYDTMHPTWDGNELIAEEIFAVAQSRELLGGGRRGTRAADAAHNPRR